MGRTDPGSSRRPITLRTRIAGTVGLLLFGIGTGLVLVEAVPRILPRFMPTGFRGLQRVYTGRTKWEDMMVGDRYLGYRPKPQLDFLYPSEGRVIPIRTVNYDLGDIGFRDIGARPPFDAVALGDSFTFCDDVPVEGCWVRHLAQATGLSIASLGVSGYSTLAETRIFERYGRQLKPRLVLLALFANDFNDNLDFDEWSQSGTDNFWNWRSRKEGRGGVGRWLAEHSMTYRVLDSAIRGHVGNTYQYKKDNLDFVFRTDRWWLPPSDGQRVRRRDRGWQLMQTALRDLHAAAADVGAELVVVLIPTKEEVYWDIVQPNMPGGGADVDHPLDVVRAFCQTNAIHACELTTAMQAEARRGRQLYLRVSGHWNDDGNAVAAKSIASCLATQGLLHADHDGAQPETAQRPQ